jgi:hypothetical protein
MRVLRKWGSVRWSWGKVVLLVSWAGVAGLGFYGGRCAWFAQATAAPPPAAAQPQVPVAPLPPRPEVSADYVSQPVAYLYDSIPITMADLGKYLIDRQGADRLDLLINRRIIEHACQEKGIEVTEAEIDAALNEDLKELGGINKLDFVKNVLKRYSKTLYEWKEDVIRPKLMLAKLAQGRVTVSDKDLHDAFEAYYGEKAECRLIFWPVDPKDPQSRANAHRQAMNLYPKLRDDPAEFDRQAKMQATPSLAHKGGRLDPVGHHTMGSPELEDKVFKLQPGEITEVIEQPEGFVVIKCDKRIPQHTSKQLADVQPQLEKEIREKEIQAMIPKVFAELREQAKPVRLLKGYKTQQEVEEEVAKELAADEGHRPQKPAAPPQGN